ATGLAVRAQEVRRHRFAEEYATALRVLGGRSLRAGELQSVDGRKVGTFFAYDGHPSWAFVQLRDAGAPSDLRTELLLHDGGVVTFPGVSGGRASWGSTVPGRLAALEGLRLVDGAGAVRYRGTVTGPA